MDPTSAESTQWESEGDKRKLRLRICEQSMIEHSCRAGTMVVQGSPQDKVEAGLRNTSSINEVYEFASKRLKRADVLRVLSITPRKHINYFNYKF